MTETDTLELGPRVSRTINRDWEDYELALGIIAKALGTDLPPETLLGLVPEDATFTLRRDVEYIARDPELGHVWEIATFTGTKVCSECHLLPLDSEDALSICDGPYGDYSPNIAAPYGLGGTYPGNIVPGVTPENLYGWERTGDDDAIESDWSGSDQYVRAYRWDWHGVTLEQLEDLARANDWDPEYGEPLMGYLDEYGVHPAISFTADGMDWNVGGVTPVYIAADYIVLD